MSAVIHDDPSLRSLLYLLADGEFHSGRELGDILGVSRTAIWKHLQKLEALGLSFSAIKGKGYRLDEDLDLLDAGQIQQTLSSEVSKLLSNLEISLLLDSTNSHVMRFGATRSSGYVCLAEQQTAGKGRRGRPWVSPFGRNIYLSVLWCFEDGVTALEGLSLAVGVAIAEAVEACGIGEVELKWPNDVLWHKRKLAGVLLEMTGDPAGSCQVTVGVGLNVAMPAASALGIGQPWVDVQSILRETGSSKLVTRNQLVVALLEKLLPLLKNFHEKKFAAYQSRWEALNAHAGQVVELHSANSLIRGTMLGVTATGALRLQTLSGEELFYGGEVSVREAP